MTESVPASDVHPDVLALAQKISDKTAALVNGVDTLDANNWLPIADEIDALNSQLQSMLIAKPAKSTKA